MTAENLENQLHYNEWNSKLLHITLIIILITNYFNNYYIQEKKNDFLKWINTQIHTHTNKNEILWDNITRKEDCT